jgi:hypothetical protein
MSRFFLEGQEVPEAWVRGACEVRLATAGLRLTAIGDGRYRIEAPDGRLVELSRGRSSPAADLDLAAVLRFTKAVDRPSRAPARVERASAQAGGPMRSARRTATSASSAVACRTRSIRTTG